MSSTTSTPASTAPPQVSSSRSADPASPKSGGFSTGAAAGAVSAALIAIGFLVRIYFLYRRNQKLRQLLAQATASSQTQAAASAPHDGIMLGWKPELAASAH